MEAQEGESNGRDKVRLSAERESAVLPKSNAGEPSVMSHVYTYSTVVE